MENNPSKIQEIISQIKNRLSLSKIFWILFGIITLFFVFSFVYIQITTYLSNRDAQEPITLTVWGFTDDQQVIENVAQGFKKLHPNITVKYIQQSLDNYRTRTQTQIASGLGPDILLFYNSWLPMYRQVKELIPAPSAVFSSNDFSKIFYPVMTHDLVKNNNVYGIPFDSDGLALFYNKEILKAQNLPIPTTWGEFSEEALKMTVLKDKNGDVITAGAGMGSTENVDYWSDILGLLFYQEPHSSLLVPDKGKGKDVITFYNSFTNPDKGITWGVNFVSTTKAFEQGNLAFYFAPFEDIAQIKSANPSLNFGIAPVPQLSDDKRAFATWGRYLSYGVTVNSKHSQAAWEFLKFLTDPETEKYISDQEKNNNGIGIPFARVDLQNQQINDPYLGAFVAQAPFYHSWYLNWGEADHGLNDEMIKNYQQAVADTGQLPSTAENVLSILVKYGAYP